ncbi:T-lymphocyte surface antigen Ly-9 isoform X6 [Neophocaena asiaeorientalis asiaeorientalis]|uniref:T-lymphocyte surface antigen Ly-9 isoform X6 n=1 Tax=Neophocaena asiaeorientalis asiaeorientalis TaxID=1706337 RepID=A0A341CEB7_NEOAA|nr:T-lymphocyte surface antigen Ly-9 isoform X6 [Neophocaena asiaeorientalis asiaeorientalis]
MMASPGRQTDGWALQTFSNKPPKSQPHIFSPCLWIPLLFLLMGLGASEKDSTPPVVKGILGGSVILSLNISVDTEIEHITWSGPQEALALADAKGKIILIDKSYQGRINVTQNNSLSINKLTLKDAGSYKAQINQKNSEVTTSEKFTLSIYEQLQEPQVTMKSVNMSENASCNITLVCSVKGSGEDVQYYWTSRDPHASESWGGPSLTISWLPCDPNLPYICRAKNPVSQSSSRPVHAWQFCTDLGASRGRPMGETVAGILGESITLSLALPDSQHIDNVVWMFNTSIISKERGEEATANQLIKFKDPNQSTVWVSSQDYSLKIGQLKMEDAGPYHAYVCSNARVASTKHINLSVYRPERRTALWSGLSLMVPFTLLCFGISGWCFWKKKGRCSAPAFSSSQVEAPADTPEPAADHTVCSMLSQGYEKVDTFPKTARHVSDSSSDSNGTTEEDEERTEMHQPANGRDQVCDLVTQEDAGHDSDSEGQAEYYLVTPDDTTLAFAIEGETVYTQVFLDFQGQTPVPQKKERSATIYCSIQKPQKVVPAPQQNDLESPEISTYENVP